MADRNRRKEVEGGPGSTLTPLSSATSSCPVLPVRAHHLSEKHHPQGLSFKHTSLWIHFVFKVQQELIFFRKWQEIDTSEC